jgi:hypothetical protein
VAAPNTTHHSARGVNSSGHGVIIFFDFFFYRIQVTAVARQISVTVSVARDVSMNQKNIIGEVG